MTINEFLDAYRVVRVAKRVFEHTKPTFTTREVLILATLADEGSPMVSALARDLDIHPANLSVVLASLADRGLIAADEGSKRHRKSISITDAGRTTLTEIGARLG